MSTTHRTAIVVGASYVTFPREHRRPPGPAGCPAAHEPSLPDMAARVLATVRESRPARRRGVRRP